MRHSAHEAVRMQVHSEASRTAAAAAAAAVAVRPAHRPASVRRCHGTDYIDRVSDQGNEIGRVRPSVCFHCNR